MSSAYLRAMMSRPSGPSYSARQSAASQRAASQRRSTRNKPGHRYGHLHENTIVGRIPSGMPLQVRPNAPNWYAGHRPGSRIRNQREQFLQSQRRLSRRNPAQFALRLAPSREYNATDPQHTRIASRGWVNANNLVQHPENAITGNLEPHMNVAESTELGFTYPQRAPRPESNLWSQWHPMMGRLRRPMTSNELAKQETFRLRQAQEAQHRARALYRSPRNISRRSRKVKSLSLKKKSRTKKHSA